MITKKNISENVKSTAVYSKCENYRYSLKRIWNPSKKSILFIMLNPSTADEIKNDPTVERCERRAKMLDFGAFFVCNIFAWRDTNPYNLMKSAHPVGKNNNSYILDASLSADLVICAWGVHGQYLSRGKKVKELLLNKGIKLHHLGLTKQNHPRHPLYISYSQEIIPW